MSATPYPPTSPRFWRCYWITLRPYLFFVSGAAGLVGLALAPALQGGALVAATVAFLLAYGLGQALTDVTQTDTDAISSPYRPLVRGEIGRGAVVATSLLGLAGCTLTFAALSPWTVPVCALAVVGLATYTPLKRRWWGGPAWNSWIVACLPWVGMLCGGMAPGAAWRATPPRLALLSVFASYAVFVILGYFKDTDADRRTGYRTLPVVFGRRAAVAVSAALALTAAVASTRLLQAEHALVAPASFAAAAGVGLWVLGLGLLALAHLRILPTTRDAEAHPAIALSVHGFVALHLGEAALLRPGLAPLAAVLFAASLAVMRLRPCREQV